MAMVVRRNSRIFSTPVPVTRRGGAARRILQAAPHRSNISNSVISEDSEHQNDQTAPRSDTEHRNDTDSSSEVLAVLRSLQQQVSALQAQQHQCSPMQVGTSSSVSSTSSTLTSTKLPKDLVAAVHQTIKIFRDRIEEPLEWNTRACFTSQHNSQVTVKLVSALENENFLASMILKAARTYFLTLQRRAKRVTSGNLMEAQKKQRKIQRKHNKLRHCRSACVGSTSLTQKEKEKIMKILFLDFISSEETGTESTSDLESTEKKRIFFTRSLPWRSPAAKSTMESLDRIVTRHHFERAKEMCIVRKIGEVSSRPRPAHRTDDWAMNTTE